MKMAKWVLQDNQKGEVLILKGDSLEGTVKRSIYKQGKQAELVLLYNPQMKMIGYMFKYNHTTGYPKAVTFNAFQIFYNKKQKVNPRDTSFEIIYEDQVMRLLAFKHPSKVKDYWLVGRWRTENELESSDDESEENAE